MLRCHLRTYFYCPAGAVVPQGLDAHHARGYFDDREMIDHGEYLINAVSLCPPWLACVPEWSRSPGSLSKSTLFDTLSIDERC